MPKVRRGKKGPKKGAAGKKGTNKRTPSKGAGTSGQGHVSQMLPPSTQGFYG